MFGDNQCVLLSGWSRAGVTRPDRDAASDGNLVGWSVICRRVLRPLSLRGGRLSRRPMTRHTSGSRTRPLDLSRTDLAEKARGPISTPTV